jgi:DNA polymerase III delta subunit
MEKQRILDYNTMIKEIERNIIKPIYLIYGEEDYLHKTVLDKLREQFSRQKKLVNYEIFYGEKLDFSRLVNSLQTLPLGVGVQCIVIRELEKIKSPLMQRLISMIDRQIQGIKDYYFQIWCQPDSIPCSWLIIIYTIISPD